MARTLREIRRPWRRQPQGASAGINRASPLAQGLLSVYIGTRYEHTAAGVRYAAPAGASSVVPTPGGLATLGGLVAMRALAWGAVGTRFALLTIGAGADRTISGSGSNGNSFCWRVNNGSDVEIRTALGAVAASAAGAVAVGETCALAAVVSDATNSALYKNGVQIATATSGNPTNVGNVGQVLANGNSSSVGTHSVVLHAAWNRALSAEEIQSLSADPWQLFEHRSLYAPVVAAGGGITADAAGTVTTTGAAAASISIAAAAAGTVSLSGAAAASLAIAAAAAALVPTAGAATGAAAISGAAAAAVALAGEASATLAAPGSITASAAHTVELVGTAVATVVIGAGSAQSIALLGATAGQISIAGAMGGTVALAGSAAASTAAPGSLTADAAGTVYLAGAASSALSIVATASTTISMSGAAAATSLASASADRTLTIGAEDRTLTIAAENRTLVIHAENRTLRISADGRAV